MELRRQRHLCIRDRSLQDRRRSSGDERGKPTLAEELISDRPERVDPTLPGPLSLTREAEIAKEADRRDRPGPFAGWGGQQVDAWNKLVGDAKQGLRSLLTPVSEILQQRRLESGSDEGVSDDRPPLITDRPPLTTEGGIDITDPYPVGGGRFEQYDPSIYEDEAGITTPSYPTFTPGNIDYIPEIYEGTDVGPADIPESAWDDISFAEAVAEADNYGYMMNRGGPVRFAQGGVGDEDTMIKKGRDNLIDRIMKADKYLDKEHRQQLESWSTEKLWKYLQRSLKMKATEDTGKRTAKRAQEQSERNLVEGDIYPGDKGAGVTRRSLETPYALPDDWKVPGKAIEYQIASGGPVRFAQGGGLESVADQYLEPGSYVLSADVMSGLGDGSSEAGFERLSGLLGIPMPGTETSVNAYSGGPMLGKIEGPGTGTSDSVHTIIQSSDGKSGQQAARVAREEAVLTPEALKEVDRRFGTGKGDLGNAHNMMNNMMANVRRVKSGGRQPKDIIGQRKDPLKGLLGLFQKA